MKKQREAAAHVARRQKPAKKKIVIGLTGSFGSGKTTVAGVFRSLGAKVIDADRIAHQLICPGNLAYKKITCLFGRKLLKKNGCIDRAKLGAIVFGRRQLLKKLERILHPAVIREIESRIRRIRSGLIVLDAPLLIEAGLNRIADKLIVVTIGQDEQVRRLKKKFSLSCEEILKRISSQIPLRQKSRYADFIIDNSGTKSETKKQAICIRRKLWKN